MNKPPYQIPENLFNEYTLNGQVPIIYKYDDSSDPEIQKIINSKYTLDNFKDRINRVLRKEMNYYGMTDLWLYQALEDYPIFEKDVALIGSTDPWYECLLLTRCPKRIIVSEYSDRRSGARNIEYHKPDEVKLTFDNYFDSIVSISSYEHDGLGRYGDPLNPNGDLEAMKEVKNLLCKDGLLILAVPIGKDTLVWNLHRIYGKVRLPMLFDGWKIVKSYGFDEKYLGIDTNGKGEYQPVFVLKSS